MAALTVTPLVGIPMIRPGDDLARIVWDTALNNEIAVENGDIFVIAQKVVSKAEGRLVNLNDVEPSQEALDLAEEAEKDARIVELILRESREVLRVRPGTIIVEHRCGFICASAGIDHSNVQGPWGSPEDWVLLLPEDPDASANHLKSDLEALSHKKVAVLIIDSHGRAWRFGTVGTAIGLGGVPGLVDQRGWRDLFGYKLQITLVAAADELAAAASLMMGQADEATPVVHVRGFPYPQRDAHLAELLRPEEQDFFR